jgi:hypothetical protein
VNDTVHLEGSLSQLTETLISIKGKPFSFDGYEFFRPIYDSPAKRKLMKCARQVAKSTFISNKVSVLGAAIPHFTSLYVAPTENQVNTFNKQKLDHTLKFSPLLKKVWFTGPGCTDQATYKKLTNGSDIVLRSCFLSPDAIRGISADMCALDEIQDILTDNIPVILECMARSEHKLVMMCGTPKTNQHAIEYYWGKSKQFEWLVKCVSCNLWNLLNENNVRYKGLSCSTCDAFLDPQRGEWVATNLSSSATIEGYRVSQLMVPWIPWNGESSIWEKFTTYSTEKFRNEVLALPYDKASCPITIEELMATCDPNLKMVKSREDRPQLASIKLSAGVDWGTGQEGASYTVLNIGGFTPDGRFVLVFSKRYEGQETDPEHQINDIIATLKRFRIDTVGVDWGMGFGMNSRISAAFGKERVHEFYNSDNQNQPMRYDDKGERWTLSRTLVMSDMFGLLKNRRVVLPNWDAIKDYAKDALNIFADYATRSGSIVMRYDHISEKPDDWFQSLMYCYMAAVLERNTV